MTRKSSPQPPRPKLTCSRDKAEEMLKMQIEKGTMFRNQTIKTPEDYRELKQKCYSWHDYSRDLLKSIFDTPEKAHEFSGVNVALGDEFSSQHIKWLMDDLDRDIGKLNSIIDFLPFYEEPPNTQQQDLDRKISGKKIFIVHGHNHNIKNQTELLLTKLKLDYIVLQDQPDGGRTIPEKLEKYKDQCGFAIILLTADDVGYDKEKPNDPKPRARQNVILELGYFWALLERSRVCVLYEDGIELPSDYNGVLLTPLQDEWKLKLAREIKNTGINVDLNLLG